MTHPDEPWPVHPHTPDPDGGADDGLGPDELALRRLLHDAVRDIEPAPDALNHLRRAVPARRTRRRQALTGLAAACLLAATAVPALLHVTNASGRQEARPGTVAHGQEHGGASGKDEHGGTHGDGTPEGPAPGGGEDGGGGGSTAGAPPAEGSASSTAGPATSPADALPVCTSDQLGQISGSTGAADGEGRVSGSFQVVNVSAGTCALGGSGDILATAQGSADPSRVQVVQHTAGDPATGLLPDPSAAPAALVLSPGESYQVKFVWIPAEGGGTTGCASATTPADPAGTGSPPETATSQETAAGADPATPSPTPDPASVTVTHTPQAGGSAASAATITDACAGTVYRTAALPG